MSAHSLDAFSAEFVSRNNGIVTATEQAALSRAKVLVAGCGSVGGAFVEPLVRLGTGALHLADPDSYDVTNLNRQACVRADVGRNKAEVLGQRVNAINPGVLVTVSPEGLTLANLDGALAGTDLVFDGIDPEMSSWVKYQLHERAARLRIPVLSGADLGGKAALYVFDYRHRPEPFYGKATAEAHLEKRYRDSSRWLGYRHFPSDWLPVMADRLQSGQPWPQVAYTVLAMGAVGSRAAVDLLVGRRVRDVITVDVHAAVKPRGQAVLHRLRMPWALLRTVRIANSTVRQAQAATATDVGTAGLRPADGS